MTRIRADLLVLFCFLSPLICCGFVVISSDTYIPVPKHCSGGQGYWCKNITTAVECRALKHCIKGVWEHQVPIERDTSTVCETCIEMVKEARDQLESNETQAEIRQVLEATCKVVPIKPLRLDCEKLMDDFGSYLVDTLASEMNPQVVCAVAGLCNNGKFQAVPGKKPELNCDSCHSLMNQIEDKIETASNDEFQTALVNVCGSFGSFSDACSNLVMSNFPELATVISENVKAGPVCSLAGVCTEKYHSHAGITRVELAGSDDSAVEVIPKVEGDDLPCDLCEQLVKHLRDVLIANTTEEEFKLVLTGICQEMSAYKNQCLEFVKDYYDTVYAFLVNELDGKVLCSQIGICPSQKGSGVVRPLLLSAEPIPALPAYQRPMMVLDPMTLIPQSVFGSAKPQNQMVCSFCEYFLHFVQQEITLPSNEKKIREVVERACSRLPNSVSSECASFVETYAAAFIAMLANRIDPSEVCPGIGVCPGSLTVVEYKDKPTCPLCLLAMEEVLRKVPNKTEDDINDALDDLCIRDVFPNSLTTECTTFITSYREPLTDMIVADFTPEEACLYSEICSLPKPIGASRTTPPPVSVAPPVNEEPVGSVVTNEISDGGMDESKDSNTCVLCEFVMNKLEKILKDKTTEEEIKESVYKICNYMPSTVTAQCKRFVEEYADLVIELLTNEVSPKEVCQALNLCDKAVDLIRAPLRKCLVCEVLMDVAKTIVSDDEVDESMNDDLLKACHHLPKRGEVSTCVEIVNQLAPQIEEAIRTLPIGPLICKRVGLCGAPQCSLGPTYWCASEENALMCQEREFCLQQVWNKNKHLVGDTKHSSHLKGTDVI